MSAAALATTHGPDLVPATLSPEARVFASESLAPATIRAYQAAMADFQAWCRENGENVLPASPEALASHLADLALEGRAVSTISKRIAAVKWLHDAADLASPSDAKAVRAVMAGIRRRVGVAPRSRKAAATVPRLAAMLAQVDRGSTKGKRDAAVLLFGFASALRRSELVALDLADVEETERGLLVTLRRSKADQEGAGHVRAIPFGSDAATCPVRAVRAWIDAAGLEGGRLFRRVGKGGHVGDRLSAAAVGRLVKAYAARAGLDASDFGGHSLRAGFVTAAAERGASAERIADHTGHASIAMVRTYTRRVDAFEGHAGEGLL